VKIPKHFELFFWLGALFALSFADGTNHHFSLCPLSNLGFDWCAGCGLGRSIASVLHGNFSDSFNWHWLGLPSLIILLHRIGVLSKKYFLSF
jgi:hypothetical protein